MLQGRQCAPELLHFQPYTPLQLASIIKLKLQSSCAGWHSDIHFYSSPTVGTTTAIDGPAIQLCAAKVAASGGDLRSAFNICR